MTVTTSCASIPDPASSPAPHLSGPEAPASRRPARSYQEANMHGAHKWRMRNGRRVNITKMAACTKRRGHSCGTRSREQIQVCTFRPDYGRRLSARARGCCAASFGGGTKRCRRSAGLRCISSLFPPPCDPALFDIIQPVPTAKRYHDRFIYNRNHLRLIRSNHICFGSCLSDSLKIGQHVIALDNISCYLLHL